MKRTKVFIAQEDNSTSDALGESVLAKLKDGCPEWLRSTRNLSLLSIGVLVLVGVGLFVARTHLTVAAEYSEIDQKVDQPFVVVLNQRLGSLLVDDIKIAPELEGRWEFQRGDLLSGDRIVFEPEEFFTVNTTYVVSFPKATRVFGTEAAIDELRFKTEIAPGLAKVGLASFEDGATVAADYAFEVVMVAENRNLRKLELRTEPELVLSQSSEDDKTFLWKQKDLLPQGQELKIEVYDTKNDVNLVTKRVMVAAEPKVNELPKQDHIGQTEEVLLTFSEPIEADSASYISVNTEGQGSWKDETTYMFVPEALEAGGTYAFTVKSGLRSKAGGILVSDHTKEFAATGAVVVTSSSPRGNRLSQASQDVKFTFDQPVKQDSVKSRFSVSSGTVAGTSWQGNTFIATVKDMGYQKTVTATLAAGIENAEFGLPSRQAFSVSFTTEIRTVKLNIPFYKQQFSGSCTAASLRMILAYKGIYTDDMSIVQKMGYNPRPMDQSSDPPVWDDPQLMFVGAVNGSLKDLTGAGADAPPVAKAAQAYGVSATAVTGISVNWIAQQIHNGKGVVFFGAMQGNLGYLKWKTPAGKEIVMNKSSHARVVTGVQGEPNAPIGFWVSDPLSGSSYWSAGALANNILLDPDRQAVVVH